MILKHPQAILFDLDDTLIDRKASLVAYSLCFYRDFSIFLPDLSADDVFEVLYREDEGGYRPRLDYFASLVTALLWSDAPSAKELQSHWENTFHGRCSVLKEGVMETLVWLRDRGILLGLVTNGSAYSQQTKVDAIGIRSYLQVVIVSEEAGVKKPDPGIFRLALAKLGVDASEAWFVGDNPEKDIIGSLNAGMTPIWMCAQLPWPEWIAPPSHLIRSLPELRPLVEFAIPGTWTVIRKCSEQDLSHIVSLSVMWETEQITYGLLHNKVEDLLPKLGDYFFVAEQETRVIGYLYGEAVCSEGLAEIPKGEYYLSIDEVYVHPQHREGRVGHGLVNAVLEEANRQGVRRSVVSSATKQWERMVGFYGKHGFHMWTIQMVR